MGTRSRGRAAALVLLGVGAAAGACASTAPEGVPEGAPAGPPAHRPLRVGIVGDQTWSPDLDAAYAVLAAGVDRLAAAGVDLVLHTGDLVESTREPAEVRRDFARAAAILDGLPVPWYLAAGDHDVNPPAYRQGSPDRSRERLFQELYGARVPAVRRRPWYAFDAGGVHFVALDSQQALHADPRYGDTFLARLHDDQLGWLAADLAAHPGPTVVFLHQPLWYQWSGWQSVHELLRRHGVVAVISGHLHYDQAGGRLDGVEYLTVGATGGLVKEGDRDAGAVHHVSVLEIGPGERVELRLLALDGPAPLALTPRRDMDRVHALDLQLGSLYDLAGRQPVFVRGGELVGDCTTAAAATLAVDGIGNPLDVPLEVRVELAAEPPAVTPVEPAFAPGQCTAAPAPGACVLAPGARVARAGPGGVEIDPAAPPLWQSRVAAGAAGPPPAGTLLHLTVRTTFTGESGPLFVSRTATVPITACP
jgi:hypothetical protein